MSENKQELSPVLKGFLNIVIKEDGIVQMYRNQELILESCNYSDDVDILGGITGLPSVYEQLNAYSIANPLATKEALIIKAKEFILYEQMHGE
jgi:hypothetical protein